MVAGRRVAVVLDVVEDFVVGKPQALLHRFVDAQIGLMHDEQTQVIEPKSIALENLLLQPEA